MADVFVPCEICGGTRFKPEVLEVTRQRQEHRTTCSQLTVDEAIRFFPREEKLGQALWQLQQVGLGYLRLGPARDDALGRRSPAHQDRARVDSRWPHAGAGKLYIMDEPTTGLHLDDIRKLAPRLDRLLDDGHTLLVIEHNLDVIKLADWIIDLGPEAGDAVAASSPWAAPKRSPPSRIAHRPLAPHRPPRSRARSSAAA